MDSAARAALIDLLATARDRGFLGPASLEPHIDHALLWAQVLPVPSTFVDLGSGAGIPGLVLALEWPSTRAVLVEAKARRAQWLEAAAEALGLARRVEVLNARAEDVARDPIRREAADLVVARSFAAPAPTAECASGLARRGGRVSVSEPPDEAARWPEDGVRMLGLGPPRWAGAARYVILEKVAPLDGRFPRRAGMPVKRPLW